MYFLLAGVIDKFHYLKLGLAVVLVFVGVKMLVTYFDYHIPILASLGVVFGVLVGSVVASLVFPKAVEENAPVVHDPRDPAHLLEETHPDAARRNDDAE